jgi:hypothetical protein
LRPEAPDYAAQVEAYERQLDLWCEAMDRLVEKTPAPDIKALATKIRIAEERTNGKGHTGEALLEDHWQAIKADVFRLADAAG